MAQRGEALVWRGEANGPIIGIPMKGRLNIFQATMLRWRELHPYNAVHVVRVDVPLDAARLTRDIDAVFAARGLAGFVLDAPRRRYEYAGGSPHTALEVLPGGGDPQEVLRAAIERGVNLRFAPSGPTDPFRFFAVDAGSSFYVGLAYDHVVAGGDSIVELLADIVSCHSGATPATPPPSVYPKTCRGVLMRNAGYVLAGMTAIPGAMASARRSLRPRYPRGDDRRIAFATMRIEKSGVAAMSQAARAWGVTRADLMIALLMRAIAPLAGDARHGARRCEIGIAWIINIRRDFGTSLRESFGQFLSSYRCSHAVPAGAAVRELAQDIHRLTTKVRDHKLYLQTLLALAGVVVLWPWLSPSQRANVDAKNYPAWAGLTPLDVDAVWRDACGAAPPPEYLRAVSTGPASPLIVAATTTGGELNLGFSYRIAAYTAEDIARIAAALNNDVNELDR
jgi:hypothetical protein